MPPRPSQRGALGAVPGAASQRLFMGVTLLYRIWPGSRWGDLQAAPGRQVISSAGTGKLRHKGISPPSHLAA